MITVLFSIKYVRRVNFDLTYRKIKVENTILLEQRIAKISSYRNFSNLEPQKFVPANHKKIAKQQNKTPEKFSCYTVCCFLNRYSAIMEAVQVIAHCDRERVVKKYMK